MFDDGSLFVYGCLFVASERRGPSAPDADEDVIQKDEQRWNNDRLKVLCVWSRQMFGICRARS